MWAANSNDLNWTHDTDPIARGKCHRGTTKVHMITTALVFDLFSII